MDAPPADNPSLEEEDDGDNRCLGVEASGDHDDDAEGGAECLYNQPKKKPPKRKEAPSPTKRKITIREDQEQRSDEGYDSDGMKGPFWNATRMEGNQLSDDEEDDDDDDNNDLREVLLNAPPPPLPPPPINATVSVPDNGGDLINNSVGKQVIDLINDSVGKHVPIDDEKLNTMKVKEIKDQLKHRDLPSSNGIRTVLLDRLKAALKEKKPYYSLEQLKSLKKKKKKKTNVASASTGLSGFPSTAYWKELKGTTTAVDPTNPTFANARPPTVPEEDADVPLNKKYNFEEVIDVPVFSAKTKVYEFKRNGEIKIDVATKEPIMKKIPRKHGAVNPVFIKKHKLSKMSRPHEFADAFIPFKSKYSSYENTAGGFSFLNLTKWTNTKAMNADAGKDGSTYKDFVPFSVRELRSHFGLYVLQGLSPSPRVEYKFKPQTADPVNGNDYVYQSFGQKMNRERRHKHFKAFLSFQDPTMKVPSRDSFPNWKVRPLLQWINHIGPLAWMLGMNISVDEMTMRMKGVHRDRMTIKFKAEGDGFMTDALCQEGYCYQHYMRNEPAPQKYLNMGFSPLHCRVLALFDSLHDELHNCGMDNLYNSAKFCRGAYLHPKKVLCHGVARKGGRGVPECVKQLEVTRRSEQLRVRGTVKAALLLGDDHVPCLVASSVYDTKPVHYLSMVSIRIEWIEVKKKAFNVDTNQWEEIKFLRMNFINNYNFTMGHVDVSDQLRGSYRIDLWVRNRKWWWTMVFWGIGTLLTNAYVVYKKVNELEGVEAKHLLTHYEFRKDIALYWINPQRTASPATATANSDCGRSAGTSMTSSRRKRPRLLFTSPNSVVSTLTVPTTVSTGTPSTSSTVSDASLDVNGSLNCRLNRTLDHYPRPAAEMRRCALHMWCGKMRVESTLLYCKTCNVTVCSECYRLFHVEADLVEKKKEIEKKLRRTFDWKKTKSKKKMKGNKYHDFD